MVAAAPSPVPVEPSADPGTSISPREMNLDVDEFIEVAVPYPHDEYICPSCQKPIETRKQIMLSKPARFAHMLNDVMKCPHCGIIFSYRTTVARVLRT